MIGAKRKPLSPEAMAAMASLPQIGLGAAPQVAPGREMASTPLVDIPQQDAASAPAQITPDTASLTQNVDLGGQGGGGILGNIGRMLKQPGVSAALLRSAGATLNGGLGAGIQAGASFMDRRRLEDEAIRQNAMDFALKQRLAANTERATTGDLGYKQGRLAVDSEGNQIRRYGIDRGAETTIRGQDINERGNIRTNATSARNTDVSAGTSRLNTLDTVRQSDVNSRRSYAGTMLNRGPEQIVTTTTKAKPEQNNWFSPNVPAVPGTSTTIKSRVPAVASDADYDALPSGSQFMGPDGTIRVKP